MSFKRKGPGVLASGAIGALVGVAIVGSVVALLALPAAAATPGAHVQAGKVNHATADQSRAPVTRE